MIGVLSRGRIGRVHVCVLDCGVARERALHHGTREFVTVTCQGLPGRKVGGGYILNVWRRPINGFLPLFGAMAIVTYDASYVASLQTSGTPALAPLFGE